MLSAGGAQVDAQVQSQVQAADQKPGVVMPSTLSDRLTINTAEAVAWSQGQSRVLLVRGGVSIVTENLTLTAQQAVIWLTPLEGQIFRIDIALIGDASAQQFDVTRQGPQLLVSLQARPDIQLVAASLVERDGRDEATYIQGAALRQGQGLANDVPTNSGITPDNPPVSPPSVAGREVRAPEPVTPLTPEVKSQVAGPVNFQAGRATTEVGPDGKVIVVLSDNVFLLQRRPGGDLIELRADRGVVFTSITDLNQVIRGEDRSRLEEAVSAVYLEGDVRVNFTPAAVADGKQRGEQRLRANRATYDFVADRAILTDAVLQAEDPSRGIPLVVRAREIRRLAQDQYTAQDAVVSTSTFASPTLSLGARRVQVTQADAGARQGVRTSFVANDVTPNAFGLPFFYLPKVWGSATDRGSPLRNIQFSSQRNFGIGVETQFGLFETLGRQPPAGLDASYRIDGYADRGPALGLDATYFGSRLDPASGEPTSYFGDFTAYYAYDSGEDRFGRDRARVGHDGEFRGQVRLRHQHYLDDNWQAQLQIAHASDIGFRPEWFESQFNNGLPYETSLYLKRTDGTEAIFVYANVDLIGFPTVADQLQEGTVNFSTGERDFYNYTVQQLPQVGYFLTGESFLDDQLTFNSANTLGLVLVNQSRSGIGEDLGFIDRSSSSRDESFPGLPSAGYNNVNDTDFMAKADLRQEISWPTSLGQVKVAPFIFGRYLGYSDSPSGDSQNRLMAGGGVRGSTTFFRIDDSVQSRLFDLDRVRHIVTPEATAFIAAQSVDRNEVFVYDEMSDGATDIHAVNLAVRQVWQTKRGQPGRKRSVDFLTLNVGYTRYGNEPDEIEVTNSQGDVLSARSFRGLWFETAPEASIARSNIYADSAWRVTDATVVLTDASYNTSAESLATAAVGVAVEREPRVRYFGGIRYIGDLNSTILSFAVDYEISRKYSASFNQAFDLVEGGSRDTSVVIFRRFEQFVGFASFFYDDVDGTGGFRVGLSPGGSRAGNTNFDLRR